MEKITGELVNNFNSQISKIINEYNLLNNLVQEQNKQIQLLTEDKNNLKTRINEMQEEKKSKSSSALWESTQLQLKEKDLIIENLKKDIEFYKRNYKNNTNLMDKYPFSGNNNKNESVNQLNIEISKQKNNFNNSNKLVNITDYIDSTKKEVKKEVKEEVNLLEQKKQEQELEIEEKELDLEEQEEKQKKKKSKKDKSKNKSEKKKKIKEIINVDEDEDINELEKELAKL
jgi:hypothetical protein